MKIQPRKFIKPQLHQCRMWKYNLRHFRPNPPSGGGAVLNENYMDNNADELFWVPEKWLNTTNKLKPSEKIFI